MVAESGAQGAAIIAVTRNQVERDLQLSQDLAHVRVLVGRAVLHDVAGVNHDVGPLPVDIRDASPQIFRPQFADDLVRGPRQDVSVADLGDDHSVFLPSIGVERRLIPRRPLV